MEFATAMFKNVPLMTEQEQKELMEQFKESQMEYVKAGGQFGSFFDPRLMKVSGFGLHYQHLEVVKPSRVRAAKQYLQGRVRAAKQFLQGRVRAARLTHTPSFVSCFLCSVCAAGGAAGAGGEQQGQRRPGG